MVSFLQPLRPLFSGPLRSVPIIRGGIVLWETLEIGMRALFLSAAIAAGETEQELRAQKIAGPLALSLVIAIGLFMLMPLFTVRLMDPLIDSDIVSNFFEGMVRLGIFLAYLKLISLSTEARRLFAYHGAEHKAVHAHEQGVPLNVREVQRFSTAHPRCGTAFILTVLLVSIIVFAFLGRPSFLISTLSRLALLPLLAAISYELIRLHAAHGRNLLVRWLMAPSLALQAMTTREPDDQQVEVAIYALEKAIEADDSSGS